MWVKGPKKGLASGVATRCAAICGLTLNMITRGWVREDWARRHHAKWVEAVEAESAPDSVS